MLLEIHFPVVCFIDALMDNTLLLGYLHKTKVSGLDVTSAILYQDNSKVCIFLKSI